MSVRLHTEDLPGALRAIDRAWATAGAPRPIQRKFFADDVATIYLKVARQAELLAIFAGVAVLIALLGLVGLVVFATSRRTKEIGIRKTLGATRLQIVRLLLWQFLQPVLIANVIAWPLAYYAMGRWLDGFARHVELGPWVFVAAADRARARVRDCRHSTHQRVASRITVAARGPATARCRCTAIARNQSSFYS